MGVGMRETAEAKVRPGLHNFLAEGTFSELRVSDRRHKFRSGCGFGAAAGGQVDRPTRGSCSPRRRLGSAPWCSPCSSPGLCPDLLRLQPARRGPRPPSDLVAFWLCSPVLPNQRADAHEMPSLSTVAEEAPSGPWILPRLLREAAPILAACPGARAPLGFI
ncbi:hypothetical protein TREES_T100000296 [Tupaia chinensis]|uniref:Uncharacterized protein n=1 Tax=Tupaia chinensis TaxID=246437 RepID=L9L518_TUPCH|nr:hypothetical protein TREES_T100000296 [Tupaia chinensis]